MKRLIVFVFYMCDDIDDRHIASNRYTFCQANDSMLLLAIHTSRVEEPRQGAKITHAKHVNRKSHGLGDTRLN